MNALNTVLVMSSVIGCLIFCVMGCFLIDNENFWTERTKMRIARFNTIDLIITILTFGYTMIQMQFNAVNESRFIMNTSCVILVTLFLAGIGSFMLSLNELPILRQARRK